jgi:hypothetical protein
MASRVILTGLSLLLAFGAFCGAGPVPAGPNLFGVLFLFAGWIVWFEWGSIQAGYSYLEESDGEERGGLGRLDPMLVRLGPLMIRKLGREKPNR